MRSLWNRWLLLCLSLVGLGAGARAQDFEVSARLSAGVVRLGEQVSLIVQVDGARDARIVQLPTVEGLRIGPVGRPSTRSQVYIVNGRRTQSLSITWGVPIEPSDKGQFEIPPLTVEISGQRLQTKPLRLKVVEDLKGENLGHFDFRHPEKVYEGEPFTLEMILGWDADIGNGVNFADLSLPWLGQLPGMLEIGQQKGALSASVEINLNSKDRVQVEELGNSDVDGRPFRLLRLRKRYMATRPGRLEFPVSHLEFGRVTRRGGFFDERRVHESYFKRSPAFTIEVSEIPEEGRPFDYTGAVGRIEAQAEVDRREVDAGESIKVTVEWTGAANLEFFEPPDPARLESFKKFRVYGQTDRKNADRRVVIYDIAPISDEVTEIPPIPLSIFDTEQEAYRTIETRTIPIRVRALAKAEGLEDEGDGPGFELDIRDIDDAPSARDDWPRPGNETLLAALFGVPLAWIGFRTWVRRRGEPDAPAVRRRRRARRLLSKELGRAGSASEQARSLCSFLAARTEEGEQAWLGRDAVSFLHELESKAGTSIREADIEALNSLLGELDENIWAGTDQPLGKKRVLQVADRLLEGGL